MHPERERAADTVLEMAIDYERTAKNSKNGDVRFVSLEIANALRRAGLKIVGEQEPPNATASMRAYAEKHPTKIDYTAFKVD